MARRMRSRRSNRFSRGGRRMRRGASRGFRYAKKHIPWMWIIGILAVVVAYYNWMAKSVPSWYPKFLVFGKKGKGVSAVTSGPTAAVAANSSSPAVTVGASVTV